MPVLRCVICGNTAITTAAHIPVCATHWKEYDDEAKRYLLERDRIVLYRLQTVNDSITGGQSRRVTLFGREWNEL